LIKADSKDIYNVTKKIKKNFIFDTNNVSKKKEPLLIIIYTNNI